MVANFLEFLTSISKQFGTGNVVGDLLIALILLTILALVMGIIGVMRRSSAGESAHSVGADRMSNIAGRIERMERSVNELRTDLMRTLEFLKVDLQLNREHLDRIRAEIAKIGGGGTGGGGGSSSGGSSGGIIGGGGEPGGGSGGITGSSAAPSDEDEIDAAEESSSLEAAPELTVKLAKTRTGFFARLKEFFAGKQSFDPSLFEELEALLLSSDLGQKTTTTVLEELRQEMQPNESISLEVLISLLKVKLVNILEQAAPLVSEVIPEKREGEPLVVMVVGVNGAGKTTTIAKLAAQFKERGAKVLLVAGDTFRAAAVDQLSVWGTRLGVPVITGPSGAKPSTVVFDGIKKAQSEHFDVVLIDTAGRLHTKANLMEELGGVKNAIQRHLANAPHETLLVVDGTTGQNGLVQAREFNGATPLTGIVVTKLDGTAKGGVVVAIKDELNVPVRYIGVGESKNDLKPFVARDFIDAIFAKGEEQGLIGGAKASEPSERVIIQ